LKIISDFKCMIVKLGNWCEWYNFSKSGVEIQWGGLGKELSYPLIRRSLAPA